jgi:hypothetical protein
MEDTVKFTIEFSKERVKQIHDALNFTIYNNKFKNPNLPQDYNIEDFITACVNVQIDLINTYYQHPEVVSSDKKFRIKNKFKEFMDEHGIKQKDISEMTGIHKANISTFLSNQKQPSIESFIRLWVAFGCPQIHEVLVREEVE